MRYNENKARLDKKYKKLIAVAAAAFVAAAFLYWQDNGLMLTEYDCVSKRLPEEFSGFKILQISDLQSKTFGKSQEPIINMARRAEPDIIVITGDLLDSRRTDTESALSLIRGIKDIAPVYYVTGNHEARINVEIMEGFIAELEDEDVTLLDNASESIERNGASVNLMGISDIRYNPYYEAAIDEMMEQEKGLYSILLSHRPEIFEFYAYKDIDAVFTGHAHGGQIRLPFVGGLLAPNQGFLPRYTTGVHVQDNTSMVISRGLGNSIFPFRIFNRPELVLVTLVKGE